MIDFYEDVCDNCWFFCDFHDITYDSHDFGPDYSSILFAIYRTHDS